MPGQRLYRSNTNASLTLNRVRLQSRGRLIDGSGMSAPASDRRLFRSLRAKMTCGLHAGVLRCVTTRLTHRSVRGAGSSRSLSEVQQTYCERTARRDRHWTAVQRFRAALNFLHAISRYHDADSLFLENFSLIRVRKFPVRQGHRFKETPRVTKPSWKLRLGVERMFPWKNGRLSRFNCYAAC